MYKLHGLIALSNYAMFWMRFLNSSYDLRRTSCSKAQQITEAQLNAYLTTFSPIVRCSFSGKLSLLHCCWSFVSNLHFNSARLTAFVLSRGLKEKVVSFLVKFFLRKKKSWNEFMCDAKAYMAEIHKRKHVSLLWSQHEKIFEAEWKFLSRETYFCCFSFAIMTDAMRKWNFVQSKAIWVSMPMGRTFGFLNEASSSSSHLNRHCYCVKHMNNFESYLERL